MATQKGVGIKVHMRTKRQYKTCNVSGTGKEPHCNKHATFLAVAKSSGVTVLVPETVIVCNSSRTDAHHRLTDHAHIISGHLLFGNWGMMFYGEYGA